MITMIIYIPFNTSFTFKDWFKTKCFYKTRYRHILKTTLSNNTYIYNTIINYILLNNIKYQYQYYLSNSYYYLYISNDHFYQKLVVKRYFSSRICYSYCKSKIHIVIINIEKSTKNYRPLARLSQPFFCYPAMY
jgi:hypothetical protein